jgi:hypothetical protein
MKMKCTLKSMWKGVENENVQLENSKVEEDGEQIMKKICKDYMFKEKFGEGITKILYFGHFIV